MGCSVGTGAGLRPESQECSQGRALLFTFCLVVGAGMGSVLRAPECCCLSTWGNVKETESVAFALPGTEWGQGGSVLLEFSQLCLEILYCFWAEQRTVMNPTFP